MKPTTSSSLCKFKPLVIPPVDGGGVGVAVPLNENSEVHAIMAEALPRYVILQSDYNNRYLRLGDGNSQVPIALKFGGDYSFDRDTRFELERATSVSAVGKFNIRCMYNNKYLAIVAPGNNWITAVADKPDEDIGKWSCTLFQPFFDTAGDYTIVRFSDSFGLVDCLKANSSKIDGGGLDKFIVINWESVVMFPNRMVLKGDNGNYLLTGTDEYLGFSIGRLRGTDTEFEVTPSRNGGIRIKSLSTSMFWSNKNSLWVFADGSESSDKNNRRNIVFRLPDAKMSKGKPVVLVNREVTNTTSRSMTVAMDFRFSDTRSSTWNASQSPSLGVKTTITSGVPEVVEGSIEISVEFSSSYEWGQTVEREIEMGSVYTVEVPSKSVLRESMIAMQGTAGIPFSYTQTDNLSDGTTVVYEKEDGWYVSANSFNDSFHIKMSAIPSAKL
ncbi:hypothetical protein MKX03_015806 [Papaver bracteatum]|nr:hypothetical protein MKX03_015806 [Papaver bracteatum]